MWLLNMIYKKLCKSDNTLHWFFYFLQNLNKIKLTVKMQSFFLVLFIPHIVMTVTQVTVISGLGVHHKYVIEVNNTLLKITTLSI